MKGLFKRKRANKGAPSGFVISLIFHAAVFFVAGLLVVFTVLPKAQPEFEPPPPVARPKMNLKKPKLKIKKNSQPKPSSRIVAKVKTAMMPEIQIPDLMGVGDGILGGLGTSGDFILDVPETVSLMGSTKSSGTDLIGVYYDLKRTPTGNGRSIAGSAYLAEVYNFIRSGWDPSELEKYFHLPQKLYLTTLVVPVVPSSFAPISFGDTEAAEGGYWLVHYKGEIVHKEEITFRFWAAGDFFLVVRVDGKIVVASAWDTRDEYNGALKKVVGSFWTPRAAEHRQYIFGRDALASVGDWITLEPGVPKDIEILVGDEGGLACAYLAVEEQGVAYEISSQGGPILPAFKTAKITHDLRDVIYPFLPEDEMICLTNGPIFNDMH